MAALTASEATIYGRWGFGPATFRTGVEVDTSPGFALRSFTDPGRVELVEPADAWPHVEGRLRHLPRPPARLRRVAGAVRGHPHRCVRLQRAAAPTRSSVRPSTSTPAGTVDGFVDLQARRGELDQGRGDGRAHPGRPARPLVVPRPHGPHQEGDLQPLPPRRPARVGAHRPQPREDHRGRGVPLAPGPRRRRGASPPGRGPPTAPSSSRSTTRRATPPAASRSTTAGGVAHGRPRTERPADVRVTAETLGSLYLSAVPVRHLHRAGRVGGTDEAVRRFAAMADLSEPPYSLTGF